MAWPKAAVVTDIDSTVKEVGRKLLKERGCPRGTKRHAGRTALGGRRPCSEGGGEAAGEGLVRNYCKHYVGCRALMEETDPKAKEAEKCSAKKKRNWMTDAPAADGFADIFLSLRAWSS